jgi:hypothetical protein
LHVDQESEWRRQSGHPKGHLFEFLGHVESGGTKQAEEEQTQLGLAPEDHRAHVTRKLVPDVEALRKITGYVAG